MRSAIFAFAAGVLLLQMQGELFWLWPSLVIGLLACLPVCFRARPATRGLALLGCLLLGFAWAGWRAEWRLADQL
ncbi:MAG: hypothetical protein LBV49_08050, partial [Azonexus sp.]|nr:hypothetical protein [Azonexus sp.]